mmetsp:Transcript_15549/g.32047  ORF Transcript_15549/g.32047 Transcript_15549/m.32047 type:complete len:167 (+) Transcript_15549:46-546(+)
MQILLTLTTLILPSTISWIIPPPPPLPTSLPASVRGPTSKSKELRYGWDGTTALGGAVDDSKPARLLEDIKEAGETIPEEAKLFLQNMSMDPQGFTFSEFLSMINSVYETGMISFSNNGVYNGMGENEGTAHVLSFAAIAGINDEDTLLLWGEHYRDVLGDGRGGL